MSVTINGVDASFLEGDIQWIYLTIDNVDGDINLKYVHVAPKTLSGVELQAYVDAQEDFYKLEIYKDMYPRADLSNSTGADDLAKFADWVTNGRVNPDGKVIEKIPFIRTHPDLFKGNNTEKQALLTEVKAMTANLTYTDLDNHIETVFGTLSTAQKNSLKRLYKVVFYLIRT